MSAQIQFRRNTAANWLLHDPVLHLGEPGYEIDTNRFKIGDNVHHWSELSYQGGGQEVPFTFVGPLTVSASPPWPLRAAATLLNVRVGLRVAGSDTTDVRFYIAGVEAAHLTLIAGVTKASADVMAGLSANDDLSVAVTTAGTDAEDLVAVAWLL